ncbi:MAG: MerR family transcriptional regulator [Merdibacter sp.]
MLKAEGGMWMHIKEAARQTEMSVRAIKHYEEKGLLQPEKDESGYRVFREQDLERLRQISVYRKLGMEITVIREVLNDPKKNVRHWNDCMSKNKASGRCVNSSSVRSGICCHRQGLWNAGPAPGLPERL